MLRQRHQSGIATGPRCDLVRIARLKTRRVLIIRRRNLSVVE
jgi:hypothetical protein